MPQSPLRQGLAEHRQLTRAAFARFDAQTNRTAGVALQADSAQLVSSLKLKPGRIFRRLVAEAAVGHFIATDAPMLVEYCVLLAKLEDSRKDFNKAKLTIKDGSGQVKSNPVVVEYTKLQQQATMLATMRRLRSLSM